MLKLSKNAEVTQITPKEFNVFQINSIKDKYEELRSKSKTITFAAQYGGTYKTFMASGGFSETEAKKIEANYKKVYKISEDWTQDIVDSAMRQGYVNVAFGLRVRAPLLSRAIKGISDKQGAIAGEARTVGNASQQSYGLLTNRAMNAFMEKVWKHPEMRLKILPTTMIHDALYFLVKDEVHVVEWLNNNLIKEMQWQELPEIQHDLVKLGAELDLFYPTWADRITIKNNATQGEIVEHVSNTLASRKTKP